MFFFDFDALDEELDSAEPHQAEVASPLIIDGPEASRSVKDGTQRSIGLGRTSPGRGSQPVDHRRA